MNLLLLGVLACLPGDELLDRAFRLQPETFRARLRVERIGKRIESRRVRSGTVVVRKGDALAAVLQGEGTLRLWLRGGKSIQIQGRSRIARVSGRFHPLDVWRRGAGSAFHVRRSNEDELPSAVSGPDGNPRAPVRLGSVRARSLAVADAGGTAPRVRVLVPRDRALARRIREIRLEIEPETFRLVRMVVDGPYAREVYSLSHVEAVAELEDSAFEIDLSPYTVEER